MLSLPPLLQQELDNLRKTHENHSPEVIDFLLSLASTCIDDPIKPRLPSFPEFPPGCISLQQAVECAGQGLVLSISTGGMIGERPFLGHLTLGKLLILQEHIGEAVQELQIARGVALQVYPQNSLELGVVHDVLGTLELESIPNSVSRAYYYFTLSFRAFEQTRSEEEKLLHSYERSYEESLSEFQNENEKFQKLTKFLYFLYEKNDKIEYKKNYPKLIEQKSFLINLKNNLNNLKIFIKKISSFLSNLESKINSVKNQIFHCKTLSGEKIITVLELRDRITELGWVALYSSSSVSIDSTPLTNINCEVKKISLNSSQSSFLPDALSRPSSRPSTPTNIPVCVTPTSLKQGDFSYLNTSSEMTLVPQRLGFDLDLSEMPEDDEEISVISRPDPDSSPDFAPQNGEESRMSLTDQFISPEASDIIMRGIRYCLSLWIMRMDEEIVLNIDRLRWLLRNSISFYSTYFTHPELDRYKEDQTFDDFISRINEEEIILALLVPASSHHGEAVKVHSLSFDHSYKESTAEAKITPSTSSLANSLMDAAATLTEDSSAIINRSSPPPSQQQFPSSNKTLPPSVIDTPKTVAPSNPPPVISTSPPALKDPEPLPTPIEPTQSPKPKTWRHISKNSPLRRKLGSTYTDDVSETTTATAGSILPPQPILKEEKLGQEVDEMEEENQTNFLLSRCPYTKQLIITKKITQKTSLLSYYEGKVFGTALLAWLALNPDDPRLDTLRLAYSKKLLETSNKSDIKNFYEEVKPTPITPDQLSSVDSTVSSTKEDSASSPLELRIIPRPPPLPTSWPPIPYTGKAGSTGSGGPSANGKLPPNSSKFRMVQVSPVADIKNSVWEKLNSSDPFKGFSPSHIFFDLKDSFSLKSKVSLGSLAKTSGAPSRAGFLSALSTELLGKKSGLKKTSDDTSSVHSRSSDVKSDSNSKKIISILDPQRSQNISIMLAKFSAGSSSATKKSSSASLIWLVDNIIHFKYKELGLININMLMSYTPSVEDQSKVIKWIDDLIVSNLDSITSKIRRKSLKFTKEDMDNLDANSTALSNSLPPKQISSSLITTNVIHALNFLNISKPDQFLYIISKIPYYNHILDIISFKLTLEGQLTELTAQCESLMMLCEELLDSEKLKFFLKCVRDMYNLLMDVMYNDQGEETEEKKEEKQEPAGTKKDYHIEGVSIDSLLKLTTVKLPQPVKLTPPPSIDSSKFSSFSSRKSISSSMSSSNLVAEDKPSAAATTSSSSSSTAFTYICSRIHLSMPQALPLNIREDLSNLSAFAKGWSANRLQNEISKLVSQVQEIINISLQYLEKYQSESPDGSQGEIPPIVSILMDVHPRIAELIGLYYKCIKRIILTSRHFAQPLALPMGPGANTFSNPSTIVPIQLPAIPPAILKFTNNSEEEKKQKESEGDTAEKDDKSTLALSPTFEAMSSFFDSMPTVEMNLAATNPDGEIDDSDISSNSITWWSNLFSASHSISLPASAEENPILTPEGFFSTISALCDALDQVQTEIVRKIKRMESTKK